MDLYFNKGVGVTQITRQIPVARSMIYRWITKFAIENGLKESSDMRKDIAKGQSQSTLQEGQSGSTDDFRFFAHALRSWRSSSDMKKCGRRPTTL